MVNSVLLETEEFTLLDSEEGDQGVEVEEVMTGRLFDGSVAFERMIWENRIVPPTATKRITEVLTTMRRLLFLTACLYERLERQ